MEIEFKMGEYGDRSPWQLIIPYETSDDTDRILCKHAILKGDPKLHTHWMDENVHWYTQEYSLPKGIIQCWNEAGCCSTALCIACLDEARETIVIG